MKSGVYCKNIDHVELEDDGMVYCQHCYRELEEMYHRLIAENERFRKVLRKVADQPICEAYDGSSSFTFIGCKLYNSDDPMEYCLRCEAIKALEEK